MDGLDLGEEMEEEEEEEDIEFINDEDARLKNKIFEGTRKKLARIEQVDVL